MVVFLGLSVMLGLALYPDGVLLHEFHMVQLQVGGQLRVWFVRVMVQIVLEFVVFLEWFIIVLVIVVILLVVYAVYRGGLTVELFQDVLYLALEALFTFLEEHLQYLVELGVAAGVESDGLG